MHAERQGSINQVGAILQASLEEQMGTNKILGSMHDMMVEDRERSIADAPTREGDTKLPTAVELHAAAKVPKFSFDNHGEKKLPKSPVSVKRSI